MKEWASSGNSILQNSCNRILFYTFEKGKISWCIFSKKEKKKTSISLADWKRPWCCKRYWGQEKGAADDEMVRWHHWLNGQNLSNFHETVKDREAWRAAVHGVVKSWTRLCDWTKKKAGRNPLNFSPGSPFSGGSFAVILIHIELYLHIYIIHIYMFINIILFCSILIDKESICLA